MIKSPCLNICSLDANSNLCLGCGRSIKEIKNWVFYSHDKKKKILNKLKKRNTAKD
jgi:uncharacterized protein